MGAGNEKIHLIKSISYLKKITVTVDILFRDFDYKIKWMLNRQVFAKLVARLVKVTLTSWLLS